ncbi:cbb3-type cytochrome c oxidase subunit 3 [Pseudomonas pseudonitroreducens]|uniref:cbb3-type cytochrome c oxidase subunit 3 n=1 Tax=Pseudomonas pseudonitroreducens TaxID=2892326 RepID=UPI001F2899DA|nr:cbb3-type cytochrome c oxidase subunit 3 [Pseudomonas pseudonitroreducens]
MTLWLGLIGLLALYFGVGWSLRAHRQRGIEVASMLPFADDDDAARRMEKATGRSRTGCACPGQCRGDCEHWRDWQP